MPLRRKKRVIGALTSSARSRASSPSATKRCCGSSARTWRWRSRTRGCSSASAQYSGDARDAGGDRPRGRVDPRSRRAARAHRHARAPADRLPHVRHPAAERAAGRARDEARHPLRRQAGPAARSSSAPGIVGYAALHKEAGARARRVDRPALHPGGRGLPVGAGDPDAAQGSLHRRVRSREPGARRVQQGARRDPDAAGEPGGGGHRERAALRGGPRRTRCGSRGS